MTNDNDDLESLLADILDDTKPLPSERQTQARAAVAVALNTHKGQAGDAVLSSPEDFLDALMNAPDTPSNTTVLPESRPSNVQEALQGALRVQQEMEAEYGPPPEGHPTAADMQATMKEMDAVFTDTEERTDEALRLRPQKMPTFTSADFAETMDIRNFATLVTLSTSRWHAKIKDKQASRDVAAANNADAEAFATYKFLLKGVDKPLQDIHKAINRARDIYYELTLPWTLTSMEDGRRKGGRLLPNTLFVDFTIAMATQKKLMEQGIQVFKPLYPGMIEAVKKTLGSRFDRREYPPVDSIEKHFDMSFDFEPIPKGDDFKGLPQVQLDALAAKVNDATRERAELAMQEVWARLYKVVARMAERLSDPEHGYHATLVTNVKDAVRLARHLNVASDTKVDALCKKIERQLCQHEAKVLRENAVLRNEVCGQAKSILQEMDK